MCEFISFFHNIANDDIAVWDLTSHSDTEEKVKLNKNLWREGHYTPQGKIELRYAPTDRVNQEERLESFTTRFPTFRDFLIFCCDKIPKNYPGSLYVSGCDLKGVTLPTRIDGSLYVSGCDLKGVTLPTRIGGLLDVSGCDLKGVTLPTEVGGSLDVRGCDLKGVTLPTRIGGSLYVRGCDLTGITLPKGVKLCR